METPSSTTRRVTRSQTTPTLAASNNNNSNNIPVSKKIEDSEKSVSKSRQRKGQVQQQQDRCALIDISNDSPIVGLANGDLETPLSSTVKQRGRVKMTPGSGEALLRGQVKTLLQKVEEEAEISKLSMDIRPFLQLVNSPMQLLAPTPANTPQIPNNNNTATGGLPSVVLISPSSVVQEQLIPQVVNQVVDGMNIEDSESEKNVLSRSLLLDFSDKSEVTEESKQGSTEDDGDSIWSIQVNASTHDGDIDDDEVDEEIAEEEGEEEDYYEDVEEEEYDDDGLDELCAGLSNIGVNEKVAPKFAGKHTRFVYDSDDDEIVEEVVEGKESSASSSDILHLKGLPTPKGKHIRFPEVEEKSAL